MMHIMLLCDLKVKEKISVSCMCKKFKRFRIVIICSRYCNMEKRNNFLTLPSKTCYSYRIFHLHYLYNNKIKSAILKTMTRLWILWKDFQYSKQTNYIQKYIRQSLKKTIYIVKLRSARFFSSKGNFQSIVCL